MAETRELTPSRAKAQELAIEIVDGILDRPESLDISLEALGADSVDLIAMEIEVEEVTGQEIVAGTFQGKTVGDLASFIEERLS